MSLLVSRWEIPEATISDGGIDGPGPGERMDVTDKTERAIQDYGQKM